MTSFPTLEKAKALMEAYRKSTTLGSINAKAINGHDFNAEMHTAHLRGVCSAYEEYLSVKEMRELHFHLRKIVQQMHYDCEVNAEMVNETSVKIADKYIPMIQRVYQDCNGIYWLYTRRGYCIGTDEEHCRSFETRKDLEKHIRMVRECECHDCVTGEGWY